MDEQKKYLEVFFNKKREKLCQFHETNDLEHEEITEFEVERAINKLNKDSAPGPDVTSNLYKNILICLFHFLRMFSTT